MCVCACINVCMCVCVVCVCVDHSGEKEIKQVTKLLNTEGVKSGFGLIQLLVMFGNVN